MAINDTQDLVRAEMTSEDEKNVITEAMALILETASQNNNLIWYNSLNNVISECFMIDKDKMNAELEAAREEIGLIIRKAREDQRLKVYQVAEMVGVSQPTITTIENGKKWTKADILARICRALGLRVGDLMARLDGAESFTPEQLLLIQSLKNALISRNEAEKIIADAPKSKVTRKKK